MAQNPSVIPELICVPVIIGCFALEFFAPDFGAPLVAFLIVPTVVVGYSIFRRLVLRAICLGILAQATPLLGYMLSGVQWNPGDSAALYIVVVATAVVAGIVAGIAALVVPIQTTSSSKAQQPSPVTEIIVSGEQHKCPEFAGSKLHEHSHVSNSVANELFRLFSFRGRIGRVRFVVTWIMCVSLVFALALGGMLVQVVGERVEILKIVTAIYLIVMLPCWPVVIWVSLAAQVKRWHDLGLTGWMVLVNTIPFVGSLFSLIILGVIRGQNECNAYGDVPDRVVSAQKVDKILT